MRANTFGFSPGTGGANTLTPERLRTRINPRNSQAIQSSYNFLTGDGQVRPASRHSNTGRAASMESAKENLAPPDAEEYESQRMVIEELKAELGTLRYTIGVFEQEREMADARHKAELEDQRRRAQDDYDKIEMAEAMAARAARQAEGAQADVKDARDQATAQAAALERRARDAEDEVRVLRDQLDDLATVRAEEARRSDRTMTDLNIRLAASEQSLRDLDSEREASAGHIQQLQEDVSQRDARIAAIEAENLRLKAQAGDAETLAIIRRELSEQVAHIRHLEASNRDQLAELKTLRPIAKHSHVIEEEKRSLQRRLEAMKRVETELSEARIQRQRLEDEKLAWASYLEGSGPFGEYTSPEDVARALAAERMKAAEGLERLGEVRAALAGVETSLAVLHEENARLKLELRTASADGRSNAGITASKSDKARARLERQRALALKEIDCLRAQLKAFDLEDVTFRPDQFDGKRAERVLELEELVDKYKAEVHALHADLAAQESDATHTAASATIGSKRQRTASPTPEDGDHSNVVDGSRAEGLSSHRRLQDELSALRTRLAIAEKELSVSRQQIRALRTQSETRVLALRFNPTADHEAVKASTLSVLRHENADLLAQLRDKSPALASVPTSVLDAALRSVAEAQAETASAHKSARRLKEVWSAKSAEFKEAIASTFGWSVAFMPNGKMRVESVFMPSSAAPAGDDDPHETSIIFDGERGTMKVGGGPRSPFARRIAGQISFWVREKACIPAFLAALTLEFYEESTRTFTTAITLPHAHTTTSPQ